MTFSYNRVWDDTVAMLRAHGRLLAPVAGVFVFLPAALLAVLLPEPQPVDPGRVLPELIEYYLSIWPWLLLSMLIAMAGGATILRLVLARGTKVGDAIVFGTMLLPFYFLISLFAALMVGFGSLALIVPGLYLWGRLAPVQAILVAENCRNPFAAIARAFEITRGRGWAVFGFCFVVTLVGVIAGGVVGMIGGILFHLAGGQELGAALTAILAAAVNSAFSVLLLVLEAAIYRALTGHGTAAAFE